MGGAERQGGQRHKVALNVRPLESGLCPVLRACGVQLLMELESGNCSHWEDPDEV